ncbi:hypothetical protein IWW36_001112 [Coemansia brasiliensis]|uniref:Serine aminopeptidase S33 domain-containing protein n=1 Tax=Coemansia brasiliensis TaxID=2650707 RepID=A0A9W8IHE8_9FUNG|nr:hypothetical protein IWW36_001112 [Coemansia brasiliensis]
MTEADNACGKTVVDGIEEETEWIEHEGRHLYTHLYRSAEQPPRATLTLVHGMGEHIERYSGIARTFARAGIQCMGFDQRGFGKTGRRKNNGRLGDNEGLEAVCRDISFINNRVMEADKPHFLFGHSMGGLNVLNYTLHHNQDKHVRGVIASAPALLPGPSLLPPRFVVSLLHQVARLIPSVQKSTGIGPEMLTSNLSERERIQADVLIIGHCALRTLSSVLSQGPQVIAAGAEFQTPVFLTHARGDKATYYQGTASFFANLPESLDKQYKEVECDFHEMHFEEDIGPSLIEEYKQWIIDHIQ